MAKNSSKNKTKRKKRSGRENYSLGFPIQDLADN